MKKFTTWPVKILPGGGIQKLQYGLRTTGVPNDFTIGGYPVSPNVTALALNQLCSPPINGATLADMDIYISPSGNDAGAGSPADPFATFARVMDAIPERIRHTVHVHVAAGGYNNFPENNNFVVEGGKLILDASGETFTTFFSGSVQSITPVTGLDPVFSTPMANDIAIATSPWTKDTLMPYFFRASSGLAAGFCLPIISNETGSLRIGVDWSGIAPGDTFDLVGVPVTINCHNRIVFNANVAEANINQDLEAQICICGIGFIFATIPAKPYGLLLVNGVFCLPACLIFRATTTDYFLAAEFKNCIVNYFALSNSTFDDSAQDSYYGWGTSICQGDKPAGHYTYIAQHNSVVGALSAAAIIWTWGTDYNEIFCVFCEGIGNQNASEIVITLTYLEDRLTGSELLGFKGSHITILSAWIEDCDKGLVLRDGNNVRIDWLKMRAGAIRGANAIEAYNGLNMRVDVSEFDLDGITNCVSFNFGDTSTYASLAVAGLWLTDTAGCYITSV